MSSARAVFLVGFMGAGKTSVGRALGARMKWSFHDLDDVIVEREGRSIGGIFRDSGERAFRNAEHAALQHVLQESTGSAVRVIALGGGAFAQSRNARLLRGATSVFLDAPVDELWSRCSLQAAASGVDRPLLQSRNQFRKLYQSRRKAYLQAAVTIPTSGRTVDEIADEIVKMLAPAKIRRRRKGETSEAE